MRTIHFSKLASANGCNGPQMPVRGTSAARSLDPEEGILLLVSDDAVLGQNLGCAAAQVGRAVVRVDRVADALRSLRAERPAAVLLDLDLPAGAAWEAADFLLQDESCPPVILLTARTEQFDVRTAIQAGAIVDKSAGLTQLLDVLEEILAAPDCAQAERNAIQRVAVRWLSPCSWSAPLTAAYRFQGINE